MTPVRVLWLIKGLGPGGAERLLVSVAQARDADAVDYTAAYVLPWKQHLVGELSEAGVPVHLLGADGGLRDPRWLARLVALLRTGEFDVVHVHSPAIAAAARPLVRARRHRPRLIVTEHNLWSSHGTTTRWANRVTQPLDDVDLAVSDEVRASMGASGRARTEVLLHGIPVAALRARRSERAAARAELGLADDDVVVATVANLRASKDHATLFAAAATALATAPTLRFVSVGQGPLESTLRDDLASYGLGDRFQHLGYRADPARVLVAADIFTLSSRHEGLPIAMLEAMAVDLPVVATAVGGIPSVVHDGVEGILTQPRRPALLADAYVRLASSPSTRAAMGERAGRRAADFDIATTARRLEAIYTATAGRDTR